MTAQLDGLASVFAELYLEVAWGRIVPGGACHAFDRAWWNEDLWVPRCNRRASYGDLQLVTLDVDPTDPVCRASSCRRTFDRWRARETAATTRRDLDA
jgi:hypothetical protein